MFFILFLHFLLLNGQLSDANTEFPIFPSCSPSSDFLSSLRRSKQMSPQFCAQWNLDYLSNGHQCCGKKRARCFSKRTQNYCRDMTVAQRHYRQKATDGSLGDILSFLKKEIDHAFDEQSHCFEWNGFLSEGKPIVPSIQNGITLKFPESCLYFGTDRMIAFLEWLGRESLKKNSYYHLQIGHISAPRGGCIVNRRTGRRSHTSHTNGLDVDIGFLKPIHQYPASAPFHHKMDLISNWWFLKKIFQNPFVCIKIIFLDRRHIRALSQFAKQDPDWKVYRKFIRHVPGHYNHFHIRIGKLSGLPGCSADDRSGVDLELEEENDGFDSEE